MVTEAPSQRFVDSEVERLKPLTAALYAFYHQVVATYGKLPPGATAADIGKYLDPVLDRFEGELRTFIEDGIAGAAQQAIDDTVEALAKADIVLEFNPHHDKRGRFARKGAAGGEMSRLPEAQQRALDEFMKANGVTHDQGVARAMELYETAKRKSTARYNGKDESAAEAGKGFYKDNPVTKAAKRVGLPEEKMDGMVAALSPMTAWETRVSMPNLDRTVKVARVLRSDPVVDINDAVIAAWHHRPPGSHIDLNNYKGPHHMSELPSEVVARIANAREFRGGGANSGWHSVDKAVRIYRGEPVDKVIGASSPKTRAFFNAFVSHGRSPTPVIDRHMVRALIGRPDIDEDGYAHLIQGAKRPPRRGWQQKAGYNFFAQIVQDGARKAKVNVHDFQAAIWYSWLADHP